MSVIVYSLGSLGCAICGTASDVDVQAEAKRIVPPGSAFVVVTDASSLPSSPASSWTIQNGAIIVDPALQKAATVAALKAYASDKQNKLLDQVWSFNVGTPQAPVMVTTKLNAVGQAAMVKIGRWAERNASVAGALLAYTNVDLTAASLTAAQAESLESQAAAIDAASYAALNAIVAAIEAETPTITTTAQIDAATWPSAS